MADDNYPVIVAKVRGVGRVADDQRCLLVAFDRIPSDDDLRAVHELLRDAEATELTLAMCGAKPLCEHEFAGWREFEDGRGGERFCQKCGLGAMARSLSLDF